MSEQTAPTPPAAPAEQPEARTVPYDRFQQVNQQAREYKQQLEELGGRLQELEERDKSELERERSKREKTEQQNNELAQRLERLEKSSWVRAAALDAKFDDPDDATAFINLGEIENAQDAEKAVKALAKRKPRLLRDESPAPQIGQVVQNGQPVTNGQPQQPEIDPNAAALLEQVKAAQEAGWTSSPVE